MRYLTVSSRSHAEMIDITSRVEELIPENFSGVCHLFCIHTTAGLTVNENADPDVRHDILYALERCVPWRDSAYQHIEENSAAHVKASMMGFDLTLPIEGGRLALGTWQGIYLCEFDGPRPRRIAVSFIASLDEDECCMLEQDRDD